MKLYYIYNVIDALEPLWRAFLAAFAGFAFLRGLSADLNEGLFLLGHVILQNQSCVLLVKACHRHNGPS